MIQIMFLVTIILFTDFDMEQKLNFTDFLPKVWKETRLAGCDPNSH